MSVASRRAPPRAALTIIAGNDRAQRSCERLGGTAEPVRDDVPVRFRRIAGSYAGALVAARAAVSRPA